ncbi:class E sortase, partial [Streptomyces sp. SID7982]|nr:class E sortase [Streptomyces sp. SID7982]
LVVTLGVVLLLLVAHQLWWTNREARADAGRTVQSLQREWADEPAPDDDGGRAPEATSRPSASPDPEANGDPPPAPAARPRTAPRWDQAYAVLRIPRIGLTAPVAEG